jgi:hypothetical protein
MLAAAAENSPKKVAQGNQADYSVVFVRTLTFHIPAKQIFPLVDAGLSVYILEISGAVVVGAFSLTGGDV